MRVARTQGLNIASELALLCVSLTTATAFSRLFEDWSFFLPIAAAVVASHAIAATTRRLGWGIARSAATSVLGLVVAVSWFVYPATTLFGVPTSTTLDELRADSDLAWATFQDVVAPAPVETGFVVALLVALWVSAFLADWAAFRLWSPVEAVVPSCALFLFAALLGAAQDEVLLTAAFVGALIAFELLHHVAKQFGSRHWINADADEGGRRLVLAGAGMGVLAVVAAVVAGPSLPGASEPAVIEWRDIGDDSPARVTVSPMVSIRSQLVSQPEIELFTVEASAPAYWRLTGLDTFDGQIWKSSGSFEDVGGTLPRLGPPLPGEQLLTQRFTIERLGQLWLPAAFEPLRVDADGADLVYEPETSTLIVSNERATSDDLVYDVESVDPTLDPGLLNEQGPVPDEITERFLDLPDDFSSDLVAQAEAVTAGGTTPYEKALLLQEWFQTEFRYNLQVDLAQDIDSIEQFLEVREGYCQQFAGTYAAFARALGIPARVAVGFTWGDPDVDNPDLYRVSGRNAHAWPEVWLPAAGWVPFEPTPGRGNPQATDVTGRPAAQEAPPAGNQPPGSTTPTTTGTAPGTVPPVDPVQPPPDLETDAGGGQVAESDDGGSPLGRLVLPGLVALAAGLLYAAIVVALRALARKRTVERLLAATGSPLDDGSPGRAQRARLAWYRATERLTVAGLERRPAETPHEFITRVEACTDVDPRAVTHLANLEAAATYGGREPEERAVVQAEKSAEVVSAWVRTSTTRWERLRAALDPRPLLPRRQRIVPSGTVLVPER